MVQRGERRASGRGVAEAGDEPVAFQPTMQRVAQASVPFPVDDPHGPFAAHEGALDERFGRRASLVPAQAVEIGFRHVAARFGQEQQAFDLFGTWAGHRFRLSAFRKQAG